MRAANSVVIVALILAASTIFATASLAERAHAGDNETVSEKLGDSRPAYMYIQNQLRSVMYAGPPSSMHGHCQDMTNSTILTGHEGYFWCEASNSWVGPGPEGQMALKTAYGTCSVHWNHPFGASASQYSCNCQMAGISKYCDPLSMPLTHGRTAACNCYQLDASLPPQEIAVAMKDPKRGKLGDFGACTASGHSQTIVFVFRG